MSLGRWFCPVLFLLTGVLLVVSLSSLPVLAGGSPCDPGIRLYPSDWVEARYVDGRLVTSTYVDAAAKDPTQGATVYFDLQLMVDGEVIQEVPEVELPPAKTNLEVLLLADVTPSLLAVSPGDQTSSYYYLALVWEGILSQFGFTGDPESTDWGRVAVPSSPSPFMSAFNDVLYNRFVSVGLPETAVMSDARAQDQAKKLLDNWLNEAQASQKAPRMVVVLRWHKEPVTIDEYRFDNPQRVPIVVVDVGQYSAPYAETIRRAGGGVIRLGQVPNPCPEPWNLAWPEDKERILKQVERSATVIQEQARRIRNVFALEYSWPVLIDSEQLDNLELCVRARVQGSPQCSAPVHLITERKGHGDRLIGALGCVAGITNMAAIFVGALLITGLVGRVIPWLEKAEKSWKNMKTTINAQR